MPSLFEDKRSELLARGRRGEKEKHTGKSRYEMRTKSRFSSSTREYNKLNMNDLFRNNVLTVNIPIRGETDDYLVKIKFSGFLDLLQDQLERQNGELNLRAILRALINAFNRDDVYIHCSCPDWKYRMNFWSTMGDINSGDPENRVSKITNPENKLGPGCKHVMLVISNTGWLIKVASVINNYIKFFEKNRKHEYADIIYPAIYGKEYEEPVQLSFDDADELISDEETIDVANELGAKSGRFQKGNPNRFQPKNKSNKDQISVDEIEVEEEDT